MHLVEVDVVDAEPPQRGVDRAITCLRDRPRPLGPPAVGIKLGRQHVLVARRSILPSSRPVISSLAPPEYLSAVSKNRTPPSTAARTIGSAAASASTQPAIAGSP